MHQHKVDKLYKDYIVIPTCKSTAERLMDALEKLDLKKLEDHLESTLAGVDKLVNNPDLAVSIRALKGTLEDATSSSRTWTGRWIRCLRT